jgi:hypothetical protein
MWRLPTASIEKQNPDGVIAFLRPLDEQKLSALGIRRVEP